MMSLTNEFKRYENYSNVMMSIKKEISSLSLQLLQKDSSENKAQVRSNTVCVVFNQGRCLIINVSFSLISSYDEQGRSCRCCSQDFKSSIMLILVRTCKILALRLLRMTVTIKQSFRLFSFKLAELSPCKCFHRSFGCDGNSKHE